MLARNATHRTASFISLDFLAPRLLCRNKSSAGTPPKPIQLEVNGDTPKNAQGVPSIPSVSSAMFNPIRLLGHLKNQLKTFHGHLPDGLSDSQIEIVNQAMTVLRPTDEPADLRKVWAIWNALQQRDILRFFGPPQHDVCSRLLVAACRYKSASEPWSQDERQTLDEIAVVAAAGGAPEGLKAYMLSLIRRKDPNAVLRLYGQFRTLLTKNISWSDTKDPKHESPEGGNSTETASPKVALPLVRSDILLAVVTAHAMQDSFGNAMHTVLQTRTRLPQPTVREFCQFLKHDPALSEKVQSYGRRLDVARLIFYPSALSQHIANLAKDLNARPLENLYNTIITGLSEPAPWLSLGATKTGSKKLLLVPDLVWTSFIIAFLRCRRTDLAERLWDDALKLGIRPGVAMWTALINGHAELKAVNEALNAWNVMLVQKVKPDVMAYRAVIYALYNARHYDEAFRRFRSFRQDLPKLSPPPKESEILVVYNTVIHGLLFDSREADARALLQEMQASSPKPDIITFNTFLRYYARNGQLKTLGDMLQMLGEAGLVGDVFTFSTILSALLKVRDDAAQIVLGIMEKQGVKPNAVTLTAIIDHQMKAQSEPALRTALTLLEKMERSQEGDARPNDITYTSILSGIHRSNWLGRRATEQYRRFIWEKMKTRGIKPIRTTYNILIKACLENPEPEGIHDALEYYRDMLKQKILPANDTWYIMLSALVRRNEWALANELAEDIRKSGFMPAGALTNMIHIVRRRAREKTKAGPANLF